MIERKCKNCGKIFYTWPCKIKTGRGLYCSVGCKAEKMIPNEKSIKTLVEYNKNRGIDPNKWFETSCSWCKKEIKKQKYRLKNTKLFYCSRYCQRKARIHYKASNETKNKIKKIQIEIARSGKNFFQTERGRKFISEKQKGSGNSAWKGGCPKCKDCGLVLPGYQQSYCKECFVKNGHYKGENSPFWRGGKPQTYKNRKMRYKNDQYFRLSTKLRSEISKKIRSSKGKKGSKTFDMIGCSIKEFYQYIESKFLPGMTWDNHGLHTWHLDHIIPVSSFDLRDPRQQKRCFHYTNLQPLWAKDNLIKHNKILKSTNV